MARALRKTALALRLLAAAVPDGESRRSINNEVDEAGAALLFAAEFLQPPPQK